MKTTSYNPSLLEVEFIEAIAQLKDEISQRINSNRIIGIQKNENADNPSVKFFLEDHDGDKHEIVVKIIQRPDN